MTTSDLVILTRWEKSGQSRVSVSYSPPSPAGWAPYCACCCQLEAGPTAYQTSEEREQLSKRPTHTLDSQPHAGYFDQNSLETTTDHPSYQWKLLALPQIR